MLAWLLWRERPVPIIQMLRDPAGELILGQLQVNSHMRALYTAPCGVDVTRIGKYLNGLRLSRLIEIQSEELEGEVSLDDLVEALGVMASGKAPRYVPPRCHFKGGLTPHVASTERFYTSLGHTRTAGTAAPNLIYKLGQMPTLATSRGDTV
ncbi:hypothetical protein NDU88_009670 [Pleurodeles waltl]|uniref:Uncharacterized protein n=1 Tax=Pleurodeles waltl TaxID=8319 RepID=A0AAV7PSV5_PLEWA|nr:hypothetical protein NDU88_009670 [Pleurodeles waltl]